ncbi:uncharacterized protein LOC143082667 [Mytilus galloprovincialis]|uniref:uncharacterized protein LOC143082667 n=1 Tax=Mytilus galloprovincialis TaxID=29158 RepID=UPI003F7CCF0A
MKNFELLFLILGNFLAVCLSLQSNNTSTQHLQDERISALERSLQKYDNMLHNLCEDYKKEPVMFYAIIKNRRFDLQKDSTVVFEELVINKGHHYNQNSGIFVAPKSGIYLFSWTVSTETTGYIIAELVIENNVISSTGNTDTNGGYQSASMTGLGRMEKNDHAFIRTTGFGTTNSFRSQDNYPQSSFLGVLISNEL